MSGTKVSDPTKNPHDRRRLIALVHMDMVGYSRLMGLDDVGTLRRLQALRRDLIDPATGEHGGRLVNAGGDSFLIAFESVEGAVRYALKVQEQVLIHDADQPPDREIRFRVGINIGDAIAEGTDLYGDAVNVAARLQAECPPDGICVSRYGVCPHLGPRRVSSAAMAWRHPSTARPSVCRPCPLATSR
jgi:adenylate cyclase